MAVVVDPMKIPVVVTFQEKPSLEGCRQSDMINTGIYIISARRYSITSREGGCPRYRRRTFFPGLTACGRTLVMDPCRSRFWNGIEGRPSKR